MSPEPKQRIYSAEFNMILSTIPDLSAKEKSYLQKEFAPYLVEGLTEWGLKDEINKLEFRDNDGVDEFELESLRHKVLSALGK
jgi:hypothetical protein